MTSQPTTMSDHLEPVRQALLDRAHERAAARVAAADEVARATLAEAAAEAEALLSEARRVGGQEADAVIAGQRAQAVRQARAVVLGARRTAFDALREQARGALRTLRQDPDYPRVVEVLRQRLRHELGPAATISDHDSGGLVAQRGGRTLSFTLDDLADRIVDRLGGEVEGLWAP